ncbi:MAG: hypothetical protein ACOC7S_00025 [Planctomycetota bacterium]
MCSIDFEKRFRETKGQPFEKNGVEYRLSLAIETGKHHLVVLAFESTSSPWLQGVHVESDGGLRFKKKRSDKLVIWEGIPEDEARIECQPGSTVCVWNVWDTGDGVTHAGHGGAAMIVEEVDEGYRCRCNDGHVDEDFDDLVFTIRLK